MKNGKFAKRGVSTKAFAMILAIVALVGITVGGTLAWLTAETNEVTNTFTVGDINIKLEETVEDEFKIVPGATDDKDPTMTVLEGSEKCYAYVCITNDLVLNGKTVATVNVDTAKWIAVGTNGNKTTYRYFEVVDAAEGDVALPVFTTVTYSGEIVKADITTLDGKTIVIDAYAHQSEHLEQTVADAAANAHFGTNA